MWKNLQREPPEDALNVCLKHRSEHNDATFIYRLTLALPASNDGRRTSSSAVQQFSYGN